MLEETFDILADFTAQQREEECVESEGTKQNYVWAAVSSLSCRALATIGNCSA